MGSIDFFRTVLVPGIGWPVDNASVESPEDRAERLKLMRGAKARVRDYFAKDNSWISAANLVSQLGIFKADTVKWSLGNLCRLGDVESMVSDTLRTKKNQQVIVYRWRV